MKILFTASLLIISLFACKGREQDFNVLPPATQTGANTGGALVNGKVWVAKVENIGPYTGGLANLYNFVNGEYKARIFLRSSDESENIWVDIQSTSDFALTSYNLLNNLDNRGIYGSSTNTYYTDSQNTGSVTFTRFDKTNQIFSGTFTFKARDANGNVVNVTEGRFDKKFTN